MSYESLRNDIINAFEERNYTGLVSQGELYSEGLQYINDLELDIVIKFPGKRSKLVGGKLNNYDYKLLLNGNSPRHIELISDLYRKSMNYPNLRHLLIDFIKDLAANGDDIDLSQYRNLEIINCGFSIEELSILIPILVLQEDLNFPRPKAGRSLIFYRYIEAILAADDNNSYDLDTVIRRTNNYGRQAPTPWPGYNNHYRDIANIDRP
ncbi:hypothetical protein AB8J26_001550 [Clostridium perfringens]|uniref:hypothetical protein n=1 Tax=Clostridium perfringens TaxID=1502 RepID=UPI0037DAAC75|nr:hypothetical protein [Clostridium perfringens]